jgi:hypothetical protein
MLGPRGQIRERACRCSRRVRCVSACLKRPRVLVVRAWPGWRRRAGTRLSDVRRRSPNQVDRGSQCAGETANAQDEQDKPAPRALGTTSLFGSMLLVLECPRDSELAILGVELTANRLDFRPVTLREERSVVSRSAALPRPTTGIHPFSVLTRQASRGDGWWVPTARHRGVTRTSLLLDETPPRRPSAGPAVDPTCLITRVRAGLSRPVRVCAVARRGRRATRRRAG